MKEFVKIIIFFVFLFSTVAHAQLGTTTATLTSDSHSNGGFSNGSGNGTGWSSNWAVTGDGTGNGGIYTAGNTAIGDGFAMWSQNNNQTFVLRYFDEFIMENHGFEWMRMDHDG